ncbi:MAG: biopolymer transporter ExbD [Elusimicrobia bacterium]|nr:biopolymer transporter ExbD [Elusimicrobiota bacterium]
MQADANSQDGITDINMTPLVDVCLVLVIIFMAVAPFAVQLGIQVLESGAKAQVGKVTASENVTVVLTEDGAIRVNNLATPADQLEARIAQALQNSRDKMVIVTAGTLNKVGQVVDILDAAKQAGAEKLAIMNASGQ